VKKKGKESSAEAPAHDKTLYGIRDDPRAAGSIRRAKSTGGLLGFGLVFLISARSGAPFATSSSRAIVGGAAGYLVVWAAAVAVWRHLLQARLRYAAQQARAARQPR
jgi:hypothetical protein